VRVGGEPPPPGQPPPAGRPEPSAWMQKVPWPLVALCVGVLLAAAAFYVTINSLPGKIPLFLLASLLVVAGLVGLTVHHLQEKKRPPEEEEQPRLHVYRESSCAIEPTLLEKIIAAEANLEQRIRDKSWEVDWRSCLDHLEKADEHTKGEDLLAAFAEY